jgi:hypothetical protein
MSASIPPPPSLSTRIANDTYLIDVTTISAAYPGICLCHLPVRVHIAFMGRFSVKPRFSRHS